MDHGFNLSTVFDTVARAVPDQEVLVWRERRLTYADLNARADGLAHLLVEHGLGCHTERDALAGHESGQDQRVVVDHQHPHGGVVVVPLVHGVDRIRVRHGRGLGTRLRKG